jgi:hypothetical protein
MMWIDLRTTLFVAAVALPANVLTAYAVSGVAPDSLASVESFASISDPARLHQPPVERGADGFGLPAMRCPICHQAANFEPGRVPGNPIWHLAPREMAWEGKTVGEICAQIKDPARNGNRPLETLVAHIGEDHLVGWAWTPGADRKPAPGTQKEAGSLVEAWVKTGAVCPTH